VIGLPLPSLRDSELWSSVRRVAIARRLRKRTRKKLRRLAEADAVLISYPKAGRTWLVTMISHVLHRRFGVPATQLVNFDNFHRIDPRIPKLFLTADNMLTRRTTDEEAYRLYAGKKILLLLRDPCDVAVSLYFHFARRSTPVERAVFGVPDDIATVPLFRFVLDERLGLPQILAFERDWLRRLPAFPDHFLVRYENLRARPVPNLARVVEFLGIAAPLGDIEAAVAFADFERLKALEGAGFFETARLRPGRADDPDSFKVRRAKVGGWRDYFDPSEIAAIEQFLAAAGYGHAPPATTS